ncbi:MAG: hypothetical protein ACOY3P_19625 [Planctomycetota bacterium]
MHYYTGCPCCGGKLVDSVEPVKVRQQVELETLPLLEHLRDLFHAIHRRAE